MEIQVGDICRTPYEPSGLVKILFIESYSDFLKDETCWVEFIEDHPHGYKKGTNGRYKRSALKKYNGGKIMKPIKAWVTEDGKIFDNEEQARRREIELKLEEIQRYMREIRLGEIKKLGSEDIRLNRFKNLELARDTLDELEELFTQNQ